MKIYYHFTDDKLRDGRPIPSIGKWLVHKGPLVPCESGLHASEHPFDALGFAPGNLLHRVVLRGEIVPHGSPVDKVCARQRKILQTVDATDLLRRFARRCALDAVEKYWPGAPKIVIDYLKTGEDSLRDAARDAAWAAAGDAAQAEAGAAAGDAARDAAWAAAWAAAGDAAWAAAGDAAWDAAWAAAWAAAGDAARAKYRLWFQEMVDEEFSKQAL